MSLLVGGTTSAWGITHARVSVASELAPWLSSPPPHSPDTEGGTRPENQRTFRQLDKELRSLYCP